VKFRNDSKNTGYKDIYSTDYHVGTDAIAVDTFNTSVSTSVLTCDKHCM